MRSYTKLVNSLKSTKTMLCVGLDTDIRKLPDIFPKNFFGVMDFNKKIIDVTKDIATSYKINFAFYEELGSAGFDVIGKALLDIPSNIFTIADAKRGDIGNTSRAYARSIFNYFNFDSVTVNPYMGIDTLQPFFEFDDKMMFVLALTSNPGTNDFQRLISDGKEIYKHIIEKTSNHFNIKQIGYVVGATHHNELSEVRRLIPKHTLLLPGVGSQEADIKEVVKANSGSIALVNVSRAICYHSLEGDYFENVRKIAFDYASKLVFNS